MRCISASVSSTRAMHRQQSNRAIHQCQVTVRSIQLIVQRMLARTASRDTSAQGKHARQLPRSEVIACYRAWTHAAHALPCLRACACIQGGGEANLLQVCQAIALLDGRFKGHVALGQRSLGGSQLCVHASDGSCAVMSHASSAPCTPCSTRASRARQKAVEW